MDTSGGCALPWGQQAVAHWPGRSRPAQGRASGVSCTPWFGGRINAILLVNEYPFRGLDLRAIGAGRVGQPNSR